MEIQGGCLWDGHSEKDWILSGEMLDFLPELENQDQIIFEYDQSGTVDCTIYSALWACSDLCNIEVTEEQIDDAVEESFNRWRTRGEGWYVKDAVNLAVDKFKEWFGINLAYYRISNYNDEIIDEVISKNYSLCTWFNGNSKYQKDRRDNGQIDNSDFGEATYGHAVCLIKREGDKYVKDNYKGRRENGRYTNIYKVVPAISELKLNGCWQNFSYVIVKVEDEKEKDIKRLNKMKVDIEKNIEATETAIALNSKMWENTNDTVYQQRLHTANEELRFILNCHKTKKGDIERELGRYMK